ncbi:serine/threonine-protein kinase [Labilithrix luteola]|nr:serine/threonine-protein kinase [Labilithrix luteola]
MVATAGSRPIRAPALTKYDVLEELGHGGMATVYRANDKRLGRDVAIKVLHPHLKESSEIAHRFAAEAKAVAKLRHPNIVEVFDVSSEDEPEQYLVVELVRGETLRKLLQQRGALPPEIAAALAAELLAALAHAHAQGVVHRDVKPENVLLELRPPRSLGSGPSSDPTSTPVSSKESDRFAVKLTDFGIAKLLDAQGVTSTGQVLGSPAHMAPEQIEGGEVDGRADVFGLGVLLYECMVGHLPFEGNNPAQVLRRVLDGIYPNAEREKPTIGKPWSQILDQALAREPESRFDDAQIMRDAIVAELARLGYTSPREELEAYFDDPEAWTTRHDETIIGRLCKLGGEARKRGDAVSAAADYNRALAYAPADPQLLRIVSTMHRAEARMRLVRRTGPLLVVVVALGAGSFFVARALKGKPEGPFVPKPVESVAVAERPSEAPPVASVPTSPSATAVSSARPVIPVVLHPRGGQDAGPVARAKRKLTFASVQPPAGVWASIDGATSFEPYTGMSVDIDGEHHVLSLSCKSPFTNKELCVPETRDIAAGEKEQSLDVRLRILPARLLVDGDPTHSYRIEEMPNTPVAAGAVTSIPMSKGSDEITVVDSIDPTKRRKVRLEPGKQETVSFK